MKKVYKEELHVSRTLFVISVLVTVLVISMMLVNFFTRGAFPDTKIGAFYIGVLLIYSFHKEALRWLTTEESSKGIRRGEYFVYTWILVTTFLYLINFLSRDYYVIGENGQQLAALSEITVTTLEVCAVFIFARITKIIFSAIYLRRGK